MTDVLPSSRPASRGARAVDPGVAAASLACALAWGVMLARAPQAGASLADLCLASGPLSTQGEWGAWALDHLRVHGVATVAMMTPFALPVLPGLRRRAGPGALPAFLLVFLGLWFAFGLGLDAARTRLLDVEARGLLGLAGAALFAAVWQMSGLRRALQARLEMRFARADRRSSDRGRGLAAGYVEGLRSLLACGGVMGVASFAGHAPGAALGATLVAAYARFAPGARSEPIAALLLAVSGLALIALF